MLRLLAILIGVATPMAVAQAETDRAALEAAKNWLRAVERGDTKTLLKRTSVPFTYATTDKVKTCERTVAMQNGLSPWMACIRKSEKLLMGEIRQGILRPADPPNVESEELKRLAAKIPRAGSWLKAYINGDGLSFTFRFLLVEGAVAAFLVETDFDNG